MTVDIYLQSERQELISERQNTIDYIGVNGINKSLYDSNMRNTVISGTNA